MWERKPHMEFWYYNFPLFDYTYPTYAVFRPWAEGEKVPTFQEELPQIFRRAEFEFLPQHKRWWDVANEAEFGQNKRIRRAMLTTASEKNEPDDGDDEWEFEEEMEQENSDMPETSLPGNEKEKITSSQNTFPPDPSQATSSTACWTTAPPGQRPEGLATEVAAASPAAQPAQSLVQSAEMGAVSEGEGGTETNTDPSAEKSDTDSENPPTRHVQMVLVGNTNNLDTPEHENHHPEPENGGGGGQPRNSSVS